MPSRTLMIRRPVYDALRKEKRKGESFSQVVERLLARPHPIESLRGLWGSDRRRHSPPPRHSPSPKGGVEL